VFGMGTGVTSLL